MYEALDATLELGEVDAVAMVAAVADFRPAEVADGKMGKADAQAKLGVLQWARERDLLATLSESYSSKVYFLGFAAQTVAAESDVAVEAELLRYAQEKLERKGADAIFVNRVGVADTGFGTPTNAGWWTQGVGESFSARGSGAPRPKAELAAWLMERLNEGLVARRS